MQSAPSCGSPQRRMAKQLDKTKARTDRVAVGELEQAASSLLLPGLEAQACFPQAQAGTAQVAQDLEFSLWAGWS